jgi:hypothetical protein
LTLMVQKGFWQDNYIGSTKTKLAELYCNNPNIAESEKTCMLEYWSTFENLQNVLCDRWNDFRNWFTGSTSPETITRCLRSLKEDGIIGGNRNG